MTMWDFMDKHEVLTFWLGFFAILAMVDISSNIAKAILGRKDSK